MQNLSRFTGRLYPVSLRLTQIEGHRCYPSVADLPEPPDCAVLAVPAAAVQTQLEDCARAGTGGCVVFASGYAELDAAEPIAAQYRLAEISRASGMRLLGPNTTGFANFAIGAHAGFAEFPGGVPEGQAGIGLISQSGALGLALAQAAMHGTAISHALTCGNSADLDVADLLRFLAGQPEARAVALTFEGLSDPDRLVAAVRDTVKQGKPVAICRVGATGPGAAAVRWHTGTDPQVNFAWDKHLAEAGAHLVNAVDTLMETASFLAKSSTLQRPDRPPRVAILSSSGGSAILAADSVSRAGLSLAELDHATRESLTSILPNFASPRNPCDATAQATSHPEMIVRCADSILSDPAVDALLLPWGKAWNSGQFEALSDLSCVHRKPICLVWMSQWLEGPGAADVEACTGLCLFRSLLSCSAALASWHN